MRILAIETSCDETAAAVTEGVTVISSVKYTQEIHSQYGGVVPSLAKRGHEERIEQIINLALKKAETELDNIDAVAVTVGPGLAIALGVGIEWARKIAQRYNKPLIGINHIEGHILSQLVTMQEENYNLSFPTCALVVSGGHTQLIRVEKIGRYKILAQSLDDDIGEAIDKGARMLGLPYPGGPALEKAAAKGNPKKYLLPLPMARREGKAFSYSGLKAAMWRLVEKEKTTAGELSEMQIADLAASYQHMVFKHLVRTVKRILQEEPCADLLVGGGVAANQTLRSLLDDLGREMGFRAWFPPNLVMCTDNAAMVGIAAGFKAGRGEFDQPEKLDRRPRWKVDEEL